MPAVFPRGSGLFCSYRNHTTNRALPFVQYGNIFADTLAVVIGTAAVAFVFFVAGELSPQRTHMALTALPVQLDSRAAGACNPVCLPDTVDMSLLGQRPLIVSTAAETAISTIAAEGSHGQAR